MSDNLIHWLLDSDEAWTRYRTCIDILSRQEDDSEVRQARKKLVSHPLIAELAAKTATWREQPLKRHNDAFGIGTDFRKLKYPFVWYNILHVTAVLSRFPHLREDIRLKEMADTVTSQAAEQRRYTASSIYRSWKSWSFSEKKISSPWLSILVMRILKCLGRNSLGLQVL